MITLFATGFNLYVLTFLVLALGPAVGLMMYVYNIDPLDKEPGNLLWRLVLAGVLAGFIASVLESVAFSFFDAFSGLRHDGVAYTVLSDFLIVGVVEEGAKYILMARRTWQHPAFNCRFDGIVYAVFVSLGFAGMENIMYGLTYGTGVLFTRALLAIPAHMGFAVLFGLFYGQAKALSVRGNRFSSGVLIATGFVLSVFLHGLYDSAAMIEIDGTQLLFLLVVVIIYVINFMIVKRAAQHDQRFA